MTEPSSPSEPATTMKFRWADVDDESTLDHEQSRSHKTEDRNGGEGEGKASPDTGRDTETDGDKPAAVRMELRPQRPPRPQQGERAGDQHGVSSLDTTSSSQSTSGSTSLKPPWRSKYGAGSSSGGSGVILPTPMPFLSLARKSQQKEGKEGTQTSDATPVTLERELDTERTTEAEVHTERRARNNRPRFRSRYANAGSEAEADGIGIGISLGTAPKREVKDSLDHQRRHNHHSHYTHHIHTDDDSDPAGWTRVSMRGRKPLKPTTSAASRPSHAAQRASGPAGGGDAPESDHAVESHHDFKKPRMCYFVAECQMPSEVDPNSGRAWPYCRSCYETRTERCLADQCQVRCPLKRYPVGTFQLYCAEHR